MIMKDWRDGYICSTEKLPDIFEEVWIRVNASRPRKAYLCGDIFEYCNRSLYNAGVHCGIGDNVYWKYT